MSVQPIYAAGLLPGSAAGVINQIRSEASVDYQNSVPEMEETTESIRRVGTAIVSYQPHMNEFVNALVNRIALSILQSKVYYNDLKKFKKGILELGENVQEIYVELAKPYDYLWKNFKDKESTVMKRTTPNVLSMYHTINYSKYYRNTVTETMIRMAFTSLDGVYRFIDGIINSLVSSANYDEYLVFKYSIDLLILNGIIKTIKYKDDSNTAKKIIDIKANTDKFYFMRKDFNAAGVHSFCPKENAMIIISADFNAESSVDVLAYAFNLDKADFIGNRFTIDSFHEFDWDRMDELFANDPGYTRFTEEQITALSNVDSILCDSDFIMIYEKLFDTGMSPWDAESRSYNVFLHDMKIITASPFKNAVAFAGSGAFAKISSVTVTPGSVSLNQEDTYSFKASVELVSDGIANKGVVWSSQDPTKVAIDSFGNVKILTSSTEAVKIYATSAQDSTKKGEATINCN